VEEKGNHTTVVSSDDNMIHRSMVIIDAEF
jgi:hypothetical protein